MGKRVRKARIFLRKNHRSRTSFAAAGLRIVEIFAGEVDEAAVAELDAGVGGDLVAFAVAFVELAIASNRFEPGVIAQPVVEHAGDGVRTILRSRAFAQDLQVFHGQCRDRRKVGAVRAERKSGLAAAKHLDEGRTVEALAVKHDQDLVRRKATERGWAHEGRGVGNRILTDEERGDDILQRIEHVRGRRSGEVVGGDDIDRRRRVGHAAVEPAGADHDDVFLVVCRDRRLNGSRRRTRGLGQRGRGQRDGGGAGQQAADGKCGTAHEKIPPCWNRSLGCSLCAFAVALNPAKTVRLRYVANV